MKENQHEMGNKLGDFYRNFKWSNEVEDKKILEEIQELDQRYQLLDKLGEGGVKQVWSARDLKTKRELALAYPKDESVGSIEIFLHEARVTADLNHPNIIPIYDIECEEKIFFTMKKLNGLNLYELLKNKTFANEPWFLLQIFSKVCDALAFAHSKGVIHLDVKPENIQVDDFGTVLVIDWGLAAQYSKEEEQYKKAFGDDVICGTLGYISPEQLDTQEGIVDERSDIYALGALLHYLISAELPVDTHVQIPFEKIKKGDLTLFRACDHVPSGLRAISEKALALDPKDRYQSVKELKYDIDRYLNGFATSAENAGFAKQLSLLIKRNKKICLTVATVSLLVSGLVVMFIYHINLEKMETQKALEHSQELKIKSDELRSDAERNLALYKAEEQDKMMMVKSSADMLAEQALSKVYLIGVDEALRRIDLGLRAWPNSDNIQYKKLHILFIAQHFNEVATTLGDLERGPYLDQLYNLSSQFKAKKNDVEKLNRSDFIDLLKELKSMNLAWLIKVFVILENQKKPEGAIRASQTYFRSLFPGAGEMVISQSDKEGVINVLKFQKSDKFHDLSTFSGLEIRLLDASEIKGFSLKSLRYIKINELKIQAIKNLDYRQLNFIEGLRKVRIIGAEVKVPNEGLVDDSIELIFEN